MYEMTDHLYAMVNKPEPELISRYDLINKPDPEEIMHFGIKGQKWGIRRYQNEDGTRTEAGKRRYQKILKKVDKHPELFEKYYDDIDPDDREKIKKKQKDLSDVRSSLKNKYEKKGIVGRAIAKGLAAAATYTAIRKFIDSSYGQDAINFVKKGVQNVKWQLHGDEITEWARKGRQSTQLLLEVKHANWPFQ